MKHFIRSGLVWICVCVLFYFISKANGIGYLFVQAGFYKLWSIGLWGILVIVGLISFPIISKKTFLHGLLFGLFLGYIAGLCASLCISLSLPNTLERFQNTFYRYPYYSILSKIFSPFFTTTVLLGIMISLFSQIVFRWITRIKPKAGGKSFERGSSAAHES